MRRLLAVVLLVTAVAAAPSVSAEQPVLDQPRHGADAVRALGEAISTVARTHDTTAAELRDRLENDLSLWVDVQGRLFYVDPPAPVGVEAAEVATTTTATPQTQDEVLALHSKPGASRTILLDFDGVGPAYGSAIGGAWSPGYTGGDGNAEPYDRDGNPAVFGTGEISEIHSIWQRVAEDYAPFDVDVTTQEVGADINRDNADDINYGTRVAMTSSATNCRCGGVAYVGVFNLHGAPGHAYYQPAFVYNVGAKAAAEAASHEAGHNLGLNHDGTASVGYYEGHGSWSPIMGVGYYTPISQWSRGEYSGANNTEDDFAVAVAHGAPLRPDDHGVGANAGTLNASTTGVIETRADVDELSFSLAAPATVSLSADPAAVSPNLDIELTLLDSAGGELAVDNPLSSTLTGDVAAGLGASLSRSLDAGTYRIRIQGVGALDPATTGYSDYGSVGAYTVTLSGAGSSGDGGTTTTEKAPGTPSVTATQLGTQATVTWTATGTVTNGELQRYKQTKNSWALAATLQFSDGSGTVTDTPGAGTFAYKVRLANGALWSEFSAQSNSVTFAKTTGGKPPRTR